MSNIRKLPLNSINILAGTQSRAELNQATVDEYADALQQGTEFPPVVVFSDGAADGNWLADGFHRYHGHRAAGLVEISCDIRVGTWRDAKLFSFGANATHGLPRSNADKKRSVGEMLADPEWSTWTQSQIAAACRVSREYVSRVSTSLKPSCDRSQDAVRDVTRNGATYQMDTAKIGRPSAPAPAPAATPPAVSPAIVHAAAPAPIPGASAPVERVTLVEQVQQQQSSDGIEQDDEDPAPHANPSDELDPFDQLRAEYDEVVGERDRLQVRNAELEVLLAQNDLASQVDHWRSNFEGISGRNAGLIKKLNQVEPEADAQREILKQIRQALGVDRNSDIVPTLKSRRAA